jgi:hypothetical protein
MTEDTKRACWKRFAVTSGLFGLVLLGAVLPAAAQPVVIFGPQKFVRTEGKPVTTRTTFHVPLDVSNCQLEISSDAAGPLTANNVSVMVNGVEMANGNTLRNGNPAPAEVELQSLNILLVTLKGKPGDSVTVKITGEKTEDAPPPPPLALPD